MYLLQQKPKNANSHNSAIRYLTFVSISAFLSLSATFLSAEEIANEAPCTTVWEQHVSELQSAFSEMSNDDVPTIVFVGTDGTVFNCLQQDIDPEELKLIQNSEIWLTGFHTGEKMDK